MKDEINKRIENVKRYLKETGHSAVIVPQTDPHQSEYLADHWEVRRFLTGFTGSAGTLVVTENDALLWVDSRYFIQGEQQLDGTSIKIMKMLMPGVPTIEEYLCSVLADGAKVGVDGMLFSIADADALSQTFAEKGISLDTDYDIADYVWQNRPSIPDGKIFIHDEKYAGQSATSKIEGVLEFARKHNADAVFISALDEIAWTLNIRCNDVEYNPVATAYLYLSPTRKVLFTDPCKIDDASYFDALGVEIMAYDTVKEFLGRLPEATKVAADKTRTSVTVHNILGSRAVDTDSPVAVPKGCKNAVEIEGFRESHRRDGAALVKAFKEIESRVAGGDNITEIDVARILYHYRSEQPLFVEESFATIAGYGVHGAIVHYEATEETNVALRPEGLLLVDSGAQYLDGTTDITRTIALGNPTEAEKHDFTLVMQGHIALDTMVFPVGTHGVQLDAEARKFLWREGLGYMHGTGHGVGHFLNVHEGPQTIRMNYTPVPIMEGMVTSNEPGLYREGIHGIRCENLVLTVPAMSTDFGDFLKFETITLYPFDIRLFDTAMMSDEEIEWVNTYHRKVYDGLCPLLQPDECEWLAEKTKPISKDK